MSSRKRARVGSAPLPGPPPARLHRSRTYLIGAAAALALAFIAYGPALRGPFLFDDTYLPFALPEQSPRLRDWVGAIRPLLMASYWINHRISGNDPTSYHVLSLFMHVIASTLVFFVLRRLVEWAGIETGRRDLLSAIGAAIFLLHPLQTESVAYIAGRSDCLSVTFLMAGYAVFLYAGDRISWARVAAVLVLFAAAVLSKEHSVVLFPLVLFTDLWWKQGRPVERLRANWRLYLPLVAGAAAAAVFLWELLTTATTAGFGMKDVSWYQYLFTQFRALLVYVRLFVFPAGQTVDHEFAISRTIFDHGAIAALAVLLVISFFAWRYRARYPLAAFGWFAFLLLMSPTSSVLPIRDPLAERRMYLGMAGLLLIVIDGLGRLRLGRVQLAAALAGVCVVGMALTNSRSTVWANSLALWQDAVAKTPEKVRPRFQLASAYYREGHCEAAVTEYATAAKLEPPTYDLLLDWGLAYDCLKQYDAALSKFREAAALEPSAHVYSQIGMVYAKQARWAEALEALDRAEKLNPNFAPTFIYKGGVNLSMNQASAALEAYSRAIALAPDNIQARQGYEMAQRQMRSGK